MKKFFISAAVAASLLFITPAASAQTEKGQKSFGLHAGYATANRSALAGLTFSYNFTRHFRLAPTVDYVFSHNSTDGMIVNIDYKGPYSINAARTVNIYPIAGLSYTSWHTKADGKKSDGTDSDVSTRKNRIGLNIGGGIEYYIKPSMKVSAEGRFNWVRHAETGLFYLSISYVF